MPSDHLLIARAAFRPEDLVGETFITASNKAAVLLDVIERHLERSGVNATLKHDKRVFECEDRRTFVVDPNARRVS